MAPALLRFAAAVAVPLLFLSTGLAVYYGLERSKAPSSSGHAASTGTHARALPGTLYVAQQGRLYSFRGGVFKQLTPNEGWTQPQVSPDGTRLVAVKRAFNFSDLYLLGVDGKVQSRLTSNASGTVEQNHWAFYPRFSPDGQSVFYSYDPKDPYNNFRVDLAVYSSAIAGGGRPRPWTSPNHYTGGDIAPTPLRSGGLVYTKYSIDGEGIVHSRIWVQARALSPGAELTPEADNCSQASVSRGEDRLVMVCRDATGTVSLQSASLDLTSYSLGGRQVLVSGRQMSSPAFSPDASSVAFYAPVTAGGAFQLWTVAAAPASPAPSAAPSPSSAAGGAGGAPVQVTTDLAFDPTGAPSWTG